MLRPSLFESLEPRRLLSAVAPTDYEQYMVQLINRARANPAAEATRLGIDLNEGLPDGTISTDPKQPLAINFNVTDAALGHSQWMLANNLFQHEGPNNNSPGDRMADSGYLFTGSYSWAENIAFRGTTGTPNVATETLNSHDDLFIDSGIADRGHRTNLMNPDMKEIGVGIATGPFTDNGQTFNSVMTTEDFAVSGTGSFLTGVAYADTVTHDNFYTPGEGLGGLTVTVRKASDNSLAGTTTTYSTGGYSIQLADGTYNVTVDGGGLSDPLVFNNITINSQNVELDITPGSGETGAAILSAKISSKSIAALKPAQAAKIAVQFTNSGNIAEAENLPISLYLSKDQTLDADDLLLSPGTLVKPLAAGKSAKFTFSFKSPLTVADDNYYFLVAYKDTSAQLAVTATPTHIIAPTTNFVPILSKVKATYKAGANIPFSIKIKNSGNYTDTANFTGSLVLRPMGGGADIPVGNFQPITKTLKSGASFTVKQTINTTNIPAGVYNLVFVINATGNRPETDTTDNTIGTADFTLT